MTIEYCETCDKNINTDENPEGEHRNIGHCFTQYKCEDCCENELLDRESLEAAQEDHGMAKRRGEL